MLLSLRNRQRRFTSEQQAVHQALPEHVSSFWHHEHDPTCSACSGLALPTPALPGSGLELYSQGNSQPVFLILPLILTFSLRGRRDAKEKLLVFRRPRRSKPQGTG